MVRRYVYWEYSRRKNVLNAAIQVMQGYPDVIQAAKKIGKFKNSTVLTHCFNVAQEFLDVPENERRGIMSSSDITWFNKFYKEGNV